jgi:hypothetical protein
MGGDDDRMLQARFLAVGLVLCAAVATLYADKKDFETKQKEGFPTKDAAQKAYDDADLNRAIQAYRFFYPTVSGAAFIRGNEEVGLELNRVFGMLEGGPQQIGFTYNSDTPYGVMLIDLSDGPFVIELPAGSLIAVAFDINQRWVGDMGLPGPDMGKGGKHLLLPPGFGDRVPSGYHVWRSTSNRLVVAVRALPTGGDVQAALARIPTVKAHPLKPPANWSDPKWVNITDLPQDTTPVKFETTVKYWQVLHEVVSREPAFAGYRANYGELAALGIVKGKAFAPDARTRRILEEAARRGNTQMRTQAFADRRPDRIVWSDRTWEWANLRWESGDFDTRSFVDLEAREKWFYQAVGASPAMFRRAPGAGSLYWLGVRDKKGAFLDGSKSYALSVPQPVPAKLFWSVTVYDADSRSQVRTKQERASLRSLFELNGVNGDGPAKLFFGPLPPLGHETEWVQTLPGKNWFAYFRIYGPEAAAFDGSWKPGDFEEVVVASPRRAER